MATPTGYVCDAVAAVKEALARWGAAPALEAPAHQCCNSWFASLPEGRQAVLRDDKWMLASAAYEAGRSASHALEAPAAPATSPQVQALHRARRALHAIGKTYDDSELRTRALEADEEIDRMLAAAPQAPAAPVGFPWRTGIPQWTDDRSVRVIAVTAHDDFGGVQVHDIRASDFHTDGDGDGAEVARVCTHWAYRDDIWPRADAVAPAAPIPWDNFPAYLIDHCEGQTITEEGLQRALSAMLANPQYAGAAPAAPAVDVDGERYRWLRRWKGQEHEPLFTVRHEIDGTLWGGDLDAAIDAAQAKEGGA
ncbi:MAG: hypothetical protein LBJ40_15455 [Delftia acidovorans]|nr:hypothetical protein [Delftia acidovorans]